MTPEPDPPPYQCDEGEIRRFVPPELTSLPQWVAWRYERRDRKWTKIPINPANGLLASSTHSTTWGTFEEAIAACKRFDNLAGIGFVFAESDPFTGVDLDNCLDADGQVKPWARPLLDLLDSYTEISPSGSGLKIFVKGTKPGASCKKSYEDGAIEIYDGGRYFTVTGHHLLETPLAIEERQEALEAVYQRIFGSSKAAPAPQLRRPTAPRSETGADAGSTPIDDDEIIRLAHASRKSGAKFAALWPGQWEGHFGSASEADSSVVFTLAYYTKDAAQIDRIFRRSGLMRPKWDELHGDQTYGQMTIAKALAAVTGQFRPRGRSKPSAARTGRIEPFSGAPEPGTIDPQTNRLILSTERTLPTAEAFVRQFHQHPEGRTIRHYAGVLMIWRNNRYVEIEDGAVRNRLLGWMHQAVRMSFNPSAGIWVAQNFPANPRTVDAALDSVAAYTHLPASSPSPSWLDTRADRPDPREIVPCRSSLLHLPTMQKLAPTPAFFSVNALDYDHDPDAPEPRQWQRFLSELFEDDLRSWDLLQEWFGYCLTGDTSQHKMLLIVGPRRSGKGTIARVLTYLVGPGNVCGPTTSSLAGPFGLQPLIGKSLAVVSDARFSGENIQTVIERLLCISGEDALTIDRKHIVSVTMKLPTRFVFLTNELPRLSDASGALVGRFMMLRLTESYYGREDKTLTAKLLAEIPGILNWSIEGWQRLKERGFFVQPASVEDALRDMEDLSSPVGAFVRQRCDVGPGLRVWIDDLYRAWKEWCDADGRVKATTKQTFGRDLQAAVPGVSARCGTDSVRFYQGIALK